MKRRRSLADLLAVAAGELLADMLDHLPLPRDHLQRLGDVLAKLAQPRAATAKANSRDRLDHPLTPQMFGEGLACRTPQHAASTIWPGLRSASYSLLYPPNASAWKIPT